VNTSMTTRRRPRRSFRRGIVLVVAGAVALAACGSDADSDADGGGDSVPGTDAPADTTPDTTGDTSAPDDTSAAFPVTIEHVFGETTIESEPQRVVSIGYAEHESILALGVTPIAVRDWYGDQPYATWPWAQDELGDAQPEVLPSTELNFEQIAALDPDLIIGVSSGIEQGDYDTLSQIAPTVTRTGEALYGTPWR
jgi:iron complex transport system substrate-binding protein